MSSGKMGRRHWGWRDWKIVAERKGGFALQALKVDHDQDLNQSYYNFQLNLIFKS